MRVYVPVRFVSGFDGSVVYNITAAATCAPIFVQLLHFRAAHPTVSAYPTAVSGHRYTHRRLL